MTYEELARELCPDPWQFHHDGKDGLCPLCPMQIRYLKAAVEATREHYGLKFVLDEDAIAGILQRIGEKVSHA